jgi:hypothetical protein
MALLAMMAGSPPSRHHLYRPKEGIDECGQVNSSDIGSGCDVHLLLFSYMCIERRVLIERA